MTYRIVEGDAVSRLAEMPADSVHCVSEKHSDD